MKEEITIQGQEELDILLEILSTKSLLSKADAYAVNTAINKLKSILACKTEENNGKD